MALRYTSESSNSPSDEMSYDKIVYPLYAIVQLDERRYAVVGRHKWAIRVRFQLPKSWYENKEDAIAAAKAMARSTDRIVLLGQMQWEEDANVIQAGS
jgi:hypothetical protein